MAKTASEIALVTTPLEKLMSSLKTTLLRALTVEPVYAVNTVSKSLPMVSTERVPD